MHGRLSVEYARDMGLPTANRCFCFATEATKSTESDPNTDGALGRVSGGYGTCCSMNTARHASEGMRVMARAQEVFRTWRPVIKRSGVHFEPEQETQRSNHTSTINTSKYFFSAGLLRRRTIYTRFEPRSSRYSIIVRCKQKPARITIYIILYVRTKVNF